MDSGTLHHLTPGADDLDPTEFSFGSLPDRLGHDRLRNGLSRIPVADAFEVDPPVATGTRVAAS